MTKRTWRGRIQAALTALAWLPALPALAHAEDGDVAGGGFSGMMGGWGPGWSSWWMWLFPALLLTVLVLVIVALVRALGTPRPADASARPDETGKRG